MGTCDLLALAKSILTIKFPVMMEVKDKNVIFLCIGSIDRIVRVNLGVKHGS
jgi:hypothetical protein